MRGPGLGPPLSLRSDGLAPLAPGPCSTGVVAGEGVLPTYLVIGAMRSGTTSLARYLGGHPEVFMAEKKELHFFDTEFERGVDWYRAQLTPIGGEHVVGEATPHYLYDEASAPRITSVVPNAKLMAILRDPVERAYSHYWQKVSYGRESRSFAEAVAAEPARISAGESERRLFSYVDRGRYLTQIERYSKCCGRDQLHVLLFEDLRDRPVETFASICRFLGVDPRLAPPTVGTAINGFVAFRSRWLRNATKRAPSRVRDAIGKLNAGDERYPPMDVAVRGRLQAQYREDNERLAAWLGRDLHEWGHGPNVS